LAVQFVLVTLMGALKTTFASPLHVNNKQWHVD